MFKNSFLIIMLTSLFIYISCDENSTRPDSEKNINTTSTGTVTDIDGNIYKTIKIGDQWWMAENLKVTHFRTGETIPFITDSLSWANASGSAFGIYDNDTDNAATYGNLYNWFAAIDGKNIAPYGWHVATDEEWKQLEIHLGMSQANADNIEWRGIIASKLRESGTEHWGQGLDSNNESGFTALPGGLRLQDNRDLFLTWFAFFWSPSAQQNEPMNRQLSYITDGIKRFSGEAPQVGMSVRCVKD